MADELVGPDYTTTVALDESQYTQLWRSVGLTGERPAVDFATSIVIHFGAVYSGTCPELRFNGVVVDAEARLVHADIDRDEEGACTADANPRAFVVAVDRNVLPQSPFRVQLSARLTCQGCDGSERTLVDLAAGITDDWLEVLRPPATRPADDFFPPRANRDVELLDDVLRLVRIYGDTVDPAFAAVDAAHQLDVPSFRQSMAAAQAAFAATQPTFDDVVARLAEDDRDLVVAVADAVTVLRRAETVWLARLADVEPSLHRRIDDPSKAAKAWNRVVQSANEARDEADARMDDFLYAIELLIDAK